MTTAACVYTAVRQDLTMFVNRISELVKHTLQQMASLHSPQAYVLAATFHPMIYIHVHVHVHVLSHFFLYTGLYMYMYMYYHTFFFTQDCTCTCTCTITLFSLHRTVNVMNANGIHLMVSGLTCIHVGVCMCTCT